MQGDAKVIEILNRVLGNELVAINQYFLHAKMLKSMGITQLADHEYKESIEEMKHAELLTDRILFLEGLPNLQKLGKLTIGETVEEMLRADLQLEHAGIPDLVEGIRHCETVGDFVSRDLLRSILENEEEHVDWLDTQLKLIEQLGLPLYQQSKL